MKKAFVTILAVAFVTLGFAFLSAGKTRSQEGGRGTSIGFVNLKKTIEGYQKTLRMEQEIEKECPERTSKSKTARMELIEMSKVLLWMDNSSKEYADQYQKYQERSKDLDKEDTDQKARYQARLMAATREVYEDIVAACETLRREKGLDFLMKIEDGKLDSESKAELIHRINSRAVLAYSNEFDLTAELITRLNK